ncbi:hypothetical protein DY000_02011402 [Brassica cretica]|uniref:Uncharacterized protein n=1 Tax=Brassica cretica TaxID=69181 RepID=A0ABQ7CXI7_BRACR|nr:hypothetical protein DY000_02011402 [Brassica cretica]
METDTAIPMADSPEATNTDPMGAMVPTTKPQEAANIDLEEQISADLGREEPVGTETLILTSLVPETETPSVAMETDTAILMADSPEATNTDTMEEPVGTETLILTSLVPETETPSVAMETDTAILMADSPEATNTDTMGAMIISHL